MTTTTQLAGLPAAAAPHPRQPMAAPPGPPAPPTKVTAIADAGRSGSTAEPHAQMPVDRAMNRDWSPTA